MVSSYREVYMGKLTQLLLLYYIINFMLQHLVWLFVPKINDGSVGKSYLIHNWRVLISGKKGTLLML